MKIKVSWVCPKNCNAITLWPFGIYVSDPKFIDEYITADDQRLLNHEKIHWRQQWQMLGIFFYLWYGLEWFIETVAPIFQGKLPKDAYYKNSFEREAFANQDNLNYLDKLTWYSWRKYIREIKNNGKNN